MKTQILHNVLSFPVLSSLISLFLVKGSLSLEQIPEDWKGEDEDDERNSSFSLHDSDISNLETQVHVDESINSQTTAQTTFHKIPSNQSYNFFEAFKYEEPEKSKNIKHPKGSSFKIESSFPSSHEIKTVKPIKPAKGTRDGFEMSKREEAEEKNAYQNHRHAGGHSGKTENNKNPDFNAVNKFLLSDFSGKKQLKNHHQEEDIFSPPHTFHTKNIKNYSNSIPSSISSIPNQPKQNSKKPSISKKAPIQKSQNSFTHSNPSTKNTIQDPSLRIKLEKTSNKTEKEAPLEKYSTPSTFINRTPAQLSQNNPLSESRRPLYGGTSTASISISGTGSGSGSSGIGSGTISSGIGSGSGIGIGSGIGSIGSGIGSIGSRTGSGSEIRVGLGLGLGTGRETGIRRGRGAGTVGASGAGSGGGEGMHNMDLEIKKLESEAASLGFLNGDVGINIDVHSEVVEEAFEQINQLRVVYMHQIQQLEQAFRSEFNMAMLAIQHNIAHFHAYQTDIAQFKNVVESFYSTFHNALGLHHSLN
jgi:hypothetical protein